MQAHRFGPFTLSREERVVWRAGKPLALAPKAIDVLLVLLSKSETFVSKREIMEAVWPDSDVEGNLTQAMYLLRGFFREQASAVSIENAPKLGYRLVGTEAVDSDDAFEAAAAPERIVYRRLMRPVWLGANER